MTLTASIFSWATLLISYQIYNVDKIQDDNLIHLTLFLEYGPMALIGKVNTNIGFMRILTKKYTIIRNMLTIARESHIFTLNLPY